MKCYEYCNHPLLLDKTTFLLNFFSKIANISQKMLIKKVKKEDDHNKQQKKKEQNKEKERSK